nr:unnamed protein product [Digitaria exilis]
MEERKSSGDGVRVCVTGGAGFIGSWLVKKLLQSGYTVHATLRNIGDEEKAALLRRLVPGAAESGRLVLFEADLYDAATFAPAIAGCQFVFLVATPMRHDATSTKVLRSDLPTHPQKSIEMLIRTKTSQTDRVLNLAPGWHAQYKSTAEAARDAARVILRECAASGTVKRVIHTGSMSTCSPLKQDSTGFKDAVDESCWTSLDVDYPLRSAKYDEYMLSKLVSEQELLGYNAGESPAFEVVTVPCSVVAGDTLQGGSTVSMDGVMSPVTRDEHHFGVLRMLQQLLGSVPLTHVDDVCDALVFCMEQPSMAGRFLCAAAYPTVADIVDHFAAKYPHLDILRVKEALPSVQAHSNKLGELGFRYKYRMEEILDGTIDCAVRFGFLDASKLIVQG